MNSSDIIVFDRNRIRLNRNRGLQKPGSDFLHQWSANALASRLEDVKRDFPLALLMGSAGCAALREHTKIKSAVTLDLSDRQLSGISGLRVHGDEEFLPFMPATFDLALSCLTLHTVNDLPGALTQIRQSLKQDGLFMAAIAGGESLYQLRTSLSEAEMRIRGGASPRVAPFVDKPQMGSLLQRAGFSLPVVDSEIVTVTYDNALGLMRDLRDMGEGNAILKRDRSIVSRDLFTSAAEIYQDRFSEADGRIRASFEIIFAIGWHPHENQQKPLQRGSAQARLADILAKCPE